MIAFNNFSKKYFCHSREGAALAYMIVIIGIVSILFTSISQLVISQIRYGLTRDDREEALQIAEAGIYYYRWYLAHQVDGLTKQQIQAFWNDLPAPYGVDSPYEVDYEGVGVYSLSVTPPEANSTIAIVQSTGWTYNEPDIQRTIQVRFRQPSWSEFSVLADADIRFGDGTDVYGPIHSNGGIRFDGIAHNLISSSRKTYIDPDTGIERDGVWTSWPGEYNSNMGDDVFLGGKEFPVPGFDFNSLLGDLAYMKEEAGCLLDGSVCSDDVIQTSTGIYFNNTGQGRHITFNGNGTIDVRRVTGYSSTSNSITGETSSSNYTFPDGGVIFVEDNVWVDGQINNAKITLVAADLSGSGVDKNIFIGNDVLYTNYDGTDVIGLIAQGDVEIIRESEDNLRIDAALVSQNGRVGREHYGTYCTAWWWFICTNWETDQKDTITVYGSIATRERYGFAYTDGTGYTNRNLYYDNNLLYYPPPYFPTGTEYAIDLWEEL